MKKTEIALRKFREAIETVKRFGVRITVQRDWGVAKNGDWHTEAGHVCACGALLLACNPQMIGKVDSYDATRIIEGVSAILHCSASQAYAVSEGFEGDKYGEQSTHDDDARPWYQVGKSLRRHAEDQ